MATLISSSRVGTIGRRNLGRKELVGLAQLLELGAGLCVVQSAPHDERLDLGNLPVDDLQSNRHGDRHISFFHGAHERDLSGRDVSHEESVRPLARGGVPEAVAQLEPLTVLGVSHATCHGQLRRVVSHQGVHVLVDQALETRTVAPQTLGGQDTRQRDPARHTARQLLHNL